MARPQSSTSALQIGLLWHTFGHVNLGVDALARADAELIRRAANDCGAEVRFVTLGFGARQDIPNLPSDVTIGPHPSIKQLVRGRSEFLRVVRNSDVVFDIGEGDSFSDIYGMHRYSFQTGTKIAVLMSGTPLVLAPQTIGPFDNPVRRALATQVMHKATAVYARDDLSTAFLEKVGVRKNIAEFMDVAFALPFERNAKSTDKVRVGLNVSGLLYNGGYTGKNELGMSLDYQRLNHEIIEALSSRPNVEVHLVSHVIGEEGPDTDVPVARKLAARYPGTVLAPIFEAAEDVKAYISGMDFMVAGRMHACIGAFSAGVPVVPVAYSRKFNGLFGTLGYNHFVDGRASTNEAALATVLAAFEERAKLAEDIQVGLGKASIRLAAYQARIASLLTDIMRKKNPQA